MRNVYKMASFKTGNCLWIRLLIAMTNMFTVKDQARLKIRTICVQIMVYSRASASVGRLKKKKKKTEKIAVFPFSV